MSRIPADSLVPDHSDRWVAAVFLRREPNQEEEEDEEEDNDKHDDDDGSPEGDEGYSE